MKSVLPLLALALLSACVSRKDPEKPPEELPVNAQPRAGFSQPSIVASEKAGAITLTVQLSGPAPAGASLNLRTEGTATAQDVVMPAMPIAIPTGATAVTFQIQAADDGIPEATETLILSIDNSFNLQPASAGASTTVSIVDDLPTARFALAQGFAAETDGTYQAEILLSSPAPAASSITLTPAGTVNPAADLSGFSTQVAVPVGSDRIVLNLSVVNDGVTEPPETLELTMSAADGIRISQAAASHTLTLIAARPLVRFNVARSFSVENGVQNNIRLSIPTPAPYAFPMTFTAVGTATAGLDLTHPASLTFPAGASSVAFPVTILEDGVIEGAEQLTVTVAVGQEAAVDPAHAVHNLYLLADARLNDTGVTGFATASSNNAPTEPSTAPGQDAAFGSDALAGAPAFDFIKLDADGNPLPASAPIWSCVRDNVTGRIWETKFGPTPTPLLDEEGDPVPVLDARQMRSHNFRFTWYDPDGTRNGGSSGSQNVNEGSEDATPATSNCSFPSAFPDGPSNRTYDAYCNTKVYIDENNAFAHCGRVNWRLPTIAELQSIANFNPAMGVLSTSAFDPHDVSDPALSATTVPGAPATVYCFDPVARATKQCLKNSPGFVRLVSDLLDAP